MRSFVRLVAITILTSSICAASSGPAVAQAILPQGHASSWIFSPYPSPLQWQWTALPIKVVQVPVVVPQVRAAARLQLAAPAQDTPAFQYDDTLTIDQRLSELRRINACLAEFPERLRAPLEKVVVRAGVGNPRAQSDGRKILISSIPLSDEELCNVVAHEMGHVIDLGLFTGEGFEGSPFHDGPTTVLSDDLSVQFYAVSWQTDATPRDNATRLDFATGYARTNVFEDFGEMTALYVRQGNYLRSLLPNSPALQAKYAFMRDQVFEGTEFNTGKAAENINARKFDSTLIGIQYN